MRCKKCGRIPEPVKFKCGCKAAKISESASTPCSAATDLWNEAINKFKTPYETNACWWVLRELQKRGCITLCDEELQIMTFNL